jgi:hypothetical protein
MLWIGWLSVFGAQTGSVVNWKDATFVRLLVETVAPEGGECRLCPDLYYYIYIILYTLAFILQLEKNHGKASLRASDRFSAEERRT